MVEFKTEQNQMVSDNNLCDDEKDRIFCSCNLLTFLTLIKRDLSLLVSFFVLFCVMITVQPNYRQHQQQLPFLLFSRCNPLLDRFQR